MPADNPFSSPQAATDPISIGDDRAWREIIRRWERLRLVFNVIVGCTGLVALAVVGWDRWQGIEEVVAYGIAANLCYFAGPLAELYLLFFGVRSRALSWVLFVVGLCLSVLLTLFLVMLSATFRGFD